jgi:hypothetical protein
MAKDDTKGSLSPEAKQALNRYFWHKSWQLVLAAVSVLAIVGAGIWVFAYRSIADSTTKRALAEIKKNRQVYEKQTADLQALNKRVSQFAFDQLDSVIKDSAKAKETIGRNLEAYEQIKKAQETVKRELAKVKVEFEEEIRKSIEEEKKQLADTTEELRTLGVIVEQLQESKVTKQHMSEFLSSIDKFRDKTEYLPTVPIGGIIDWIPPKNSKDEKLALPPGFQLCDGSAVIDKESLFFGQKTPNIIGRVTIGSGRKSVGDTGGSFEHDFSHSHRTPFALVGKKLSFINYSTTEDVAIKTDCFQINLEPKTYSHTVSQYVTSTAMPKKVSIVPPYLQTMRIIRIK